MKCLFCKQEEMYPGHVTVVLQRGDTTVVFKEVPADICKNCGEYYLSEEITGKLMERAEEAVRKKTEVEILKFAA